MAAFPTLHRRSRRRQGSVATYVGLALPVIGGFSALSIEYVYLREVELELEGVSAAASHAAMVGIREPGATVDSARAMAISVVHGSMVDQHPYSLDPDDVTFGFYDGSAFHPTEVVGDINAVRVPLTVDEVGLGFGKAFFGRDHSVSTCAAIAVGEGNASTSEIGGPGLANGHFDFDSTDARRFCPGNWSCFWTSRHTHEYDDQFSTTATNAFGNLGGHLPVNGCTGNDGRPGACDGSTYTRTIPDGVEFKVVVLNADLSPGGWITINGVEYAVDYYDDLPFSSLPTYTLGTGTNRLLQLGVSFDVDTIANCELLPTNTSEVRANVPGVYGEWRSGALTVQLVRPTAIPTPGLSAGDHAAVTSQSAGLLWEGTFFWHWDGPSYVASQAAAWQEAYDALDCPEPEFIDSANGGTVCP